MSNSDNELLAEDAKRPRLDTPESADASEGRDSVEYCYVCDELIVGKKYPIANCLTNTTKTRLIEILGRLVSEKYVVVVSNIDKICRTCANLLNNLDRLESELMTTRQTVLSSIERKYNLHDDDLYNRTMPKNVVFGNTQNLKSTYEKSGLKGQDSTKSKPFKGTSVLPQKPASVTIKTTSSASSTAASPAKTSMPKTVPQNVLMQCNQCQYTTNQRPVMLEHLRQHKAKQNPDVKDEGENSTENPDLHLSTDGDASP